MDKEFATNLASVLGYYQKIANNKIWIINKYI